MHNLLFYVFAVFTIFPFLGFSQDALNVKLIGNEVKSDLRYSGSWYYVDDEGNEYGLLGAFSGTAIYSIPTVGPMEEVGFISGPGSNWRELTVLGDYAYVTTEGTDTIPTGMQVIDLSQLPDTAFLVNNFNTSFTRGHILQRDIYSNAPYIYVIGTQSTDGVHILDVSNPLNPIEVGLYAPGYYIHDAHINGDLLFGCAFNLGQVDIVDISDKTNPQLIATLEDPGFNTHSAWLTEDKTHLFLMDESDGLPARIFNVEDLEDIYEVASYTANSASLVHNPYIRGDFTFMSHNTEGLRVVDIKDPSLPVEVGYYDTFDGPSGGFSGLWSACPYLPSNRIIGGDRTKGIFVWEFNDTQAARIYGTVIDSISGESIENAEVILVENSDTLYTGQDGTFKFGIYPGAVTLQVSAEEYMDLTDNIELGAGVDVDLVIPLSSFNVSVETSPALTCKFFPNPTSSTVMVQVPKEYIGEKIEVVNVKGQVVYTERITLKLFMVPIQQFTQGISFLQILNQQGEVLIRERMLVPE